MAVTDTDPIPAPAGELPPPEPPAHECPHCGEIAELREHVAATDVAVAALATAEASEAADEEAFWDGLAMEMIDDATE